MPFISLSDAGQCVSSRELSPGSYHVTSLALSDDARSNAKEVGIGKTDVLEARDDKSCIFTSSLQSCFPVVFRFKNGDIALHHGSYPTLEHVVHLLKRKDLVEIQLFDKGTAVNSPKVKFFAQKLEAYYSNDRRKPNINIHQEDETRRYHVALCYRNAGGEPIILVGDSMKEGAFANDISKCIHHEDQIQPYHFVPAAQRFPVVSMEEQQKLKKEIQALRKRAHDDDSTCRII